MKPLHIIYALIGILFVGGAIWFFFFKPVPETIEVVNTPLPSTQNTTNTTIEPTSTTNTPTDTTTPVEFSTQKVFKISDGPISGAAFFETKNPTTTLARYTLANNGHILDLAIDVPGAVAKSASNTTVPGVVRTLWGPQGRVVIMQYLENATLKTVSLTFSDRTSTSTPPVKLQFFPEGIADIALSPDGTQAAYLLRTQNGVDGYISQSNGSNSQKKFSIPFTQVVLAWPSPQTLLVQTKSAYSAPGIAFSVDVTSGNVVPLLHASGLVAFANPTFSHVVYQSTNSDLRSHTSYVHSMQNGGEASLSYNPLVEKCAWSSINATVLYCARPLQTVSASYIDSWRMGTASMADVIFSYDVARNSSSILATPGGNQGGVGSDITTLGVSPNGRYLLFITKGDRSLWGVRLGN